MSDLIIKAVIGANYGDEGKGLVTNYFCKQFADNNQKCIVVCTNGGAQRGHTVCMPAGFRHVFHHFGSGTFNGADTLFPNEFILNPMQFKKEYDEIKKYILNCNIFANANCFVTTPYDMIINMLVEESRNNNRHGSTGFGIWETIKRCSINDYKLTLFDLFKSNLKKLLLNIRNIYYNKIIKEYNIILTDEWKNIFYSDNLLHNFINDCNFFINHIKVIDDENIISNYSGIIFENGQGLLLDQNRLEFGNHTTPSNTGCKNVFNILKRTNLLTENIELCYITRTYLTRHGAGPFKEECDYKLINENLNDKTNVYNPFQGNIRYGMLNKYNLIKRINNDFNSENWSVFVKKSCVITHINEYQLDYTNFNKLFNNVYISDNELNLMINNLKY